MSSPHGPALADIFRSDPAAVRCPFPTYNRLREEEPITYVEDAEAWLVTRYDDISFISRHPQLFSSEMPNGPRMTRGRDRAVADVFESDPELGADLARLRGGTRVLIMADPPDHARQRRLVNRAFTPAKIRGHEPFIRAQVERLVGDLVERGSGEIVRDLGVPLPLLVMSQLLGIPEADLPQFKRWSDAVVKSVGNDLLTTEVMREILMTQYELFTYLKGVVAEHRADPGDDLICDVLGATIDDEPLSDAEVMNMLVQFLVAGNETTTDLMTAAVRTLADDPALADRLRADLDLVPGFVEETLRLNPPVVGFYRRAVMDTEVGGVAIKAGDHVMMVYAAGNRDGTRFDEPERFDECRSDAVNLSFGIGPHHCLGASLARTEARIALQELLRRTSSIALAEDASLTFHPSYIFHGLERLHVVLEGI